jgi:hypothetical protein
MVTEKREEIIRENEQNFVQGASTPDGPLKYMDEVKKDQVHRQIDAKMRELEETGLTRMEILYGKQLGVPLMDDPFYQMVKKSRAAREMLLKPGEEFTAERVIEHALR